MSPELYRQACSIYEEAVDVEPERLDSFLDRACGGDAELREQVASMLSADREIPKDFLAKPAIHAAAQLLAHQTQSDAPANVSGAVFGNYRAGKQIGAGGMGTVYEAVDLRLDRKVALKILPALYVSDPERVRRFEQEARAASLLNHPNIVSIYDANYDESAGLHYIAIELVQGQTLREIIREARSIDTKELLDIATQIASALRAAHQAGILHRDIKPENVMVRSDGIVKVLDFGLAKLLDDTGSDPNREPVSHTRHGNVAGTVHYLSPEQVLGKKATPRSDLFSLGIVLYELASGKRPFEGPTDGAVFEAILHAVPDRLSDLRQGLAPAFDAIVLRLLEKDPDLRFQTADDLRSALKLLDRDSQSGLSTPAAEALPKQQKRTWIIPAIAASAATAALVLASLWFGPQIKGLPNEQPLFYERLTMDPGEPEYPSLSPDGKQFAYASRESGNWDVYLRRTGGMTSINLTKDHLGDDSQPSFSHDGTRVAFRSERDGGGVFVMEVTGENPRRVSRRGYHPSWSPDDRKLVCAQGSIDNPSRFSGSRGPLFIVDLATGSERLLDKTQSARQPAWSPSGDLIAYWAIPSDGAQRDLLAVRADDPAAEPVHITSDAALDWAPAWMPSSNELMFLSDRGGLMNVWKIAVNPRSGAPSGAPVPVTVPAPYTRHLSVAGDGSRFAFVRSEQPMRLYTAPLDPKARRVTAAAAPVGDRTSWIASFSLSPDGSRIAFDTLGDSHEDLWVMNADGSQPRRLTNDLAKDREPSWSPDGRELAFYSDRASGGTYEVWAIGADGSGLRQVSAVSKPGNYVQTPTWKHDGKELLVWSSSGSPVSMPAHPPSPVSTATLLRGLDNMGNIQLSLWTRPAKPAPSDRSNLWLVNDSSQQRIWIHDLTAGTNQETAARGDSPYWLPGQKQFVFKRGSAIYLFDLSSRSEHLLLDASPARLWMLRVSPDGSRMYFSGSRRDNDIWLARFTK